MYEQIFFDLGRNALRHLIRTYEIKAMYIPYYLCDVIRHTLVEEKCKPIFYHIDDNFLPSENLPENDYILYPNYFGIFSKNIENLVKIYPKLIVDNSHAYYDKPSGFACFNSGHKFGFKNSILYVKNKNNICKISTYGKSKRLKKFLYLHQKYKDSNNLKISISSLEAPFVYPYLADTIDIADSLAKSLKEEGKTIYRYWNPLPQNFNEYKFYSRLVPIPVLP